MSRIKTRLRPPLRPSDQRHNGFKDKPVEETFSWKTFDSDIKNQAGVSLFSLKGIEAPAHWSQTAVDIVASKYFSRPHEKSVRQLVHRISLGLQTALKKSRIYKNKKERDEVLGRVKYLLYSQSAAFNSPVWFNCGLSEAYDLKSPSPHFAYDEKSDQIISVRDAYARPQVSACFIQSVDDSLDSIYELLKTEAHLFKYGSGTGSNFSALRSKYEKLKSGGLSSGLISFLEVFDKSAGSIKSGGVTRRAAKMVCLDADHPEILDFVDWKKNEERKARILVQGGLSGDLDGDVYKTISGQNSNNSVRINDRFMDALQKDGPWSLRYPSSMKVFKKIPARELWDRICESAWECADPGIQFHDTINDFNTCIASGEIQASNPCSEFMFLNDTACNLASINLVRYYEKRDGNYFFNFAQFANDVSTLIDIQEALVDYASYPSLKIARNSHDFRPLGLGFANLGVLLMLMGHPYDSAAGRAWAAAITSIMTAQAYLRSAGIARLKGPFPLYAKNRRSVLSVIEKHARASKNIEWRYLPVPVVQLANTLWKNARLEARKFGVRNAQVTVIAPTGTIGLVMDCGTTGIEPEYALLKTKKLSGGGRIESVNESIDQALKNLLYGQKDRQEIIEFIRQRGTVKNCPKLKSEHTTIFSTAHGELAISAEGHLEMMAAVQPFLSGAISKTVNMPADATVSEVSEVYTKAWNLGLKSVSVYRDQSKFVQPLNAVASVSESAPPCLICGAPTRLEAGCFKCSNCGFTSSCVG